MLCVRSAGHKYIFGCRPKQENFLLDWHESSQNVINRIFLSNKSDTPESLASELETKLNESSICQPSPGYNVVFDEDRGSLRSTRTGDATKSFFLVNDDLLQQLASTDFVFKPMTMVRNHG